MALTKTRRIICVLCWMPLIAGQSNWCAFQVHVKTPSGAPFAGVPVVLASGGKQLTEVRTDARGIANICDAPLTAVTIAVGFDACGSVLVKDVKALWLRTRRLDVTYVKSTCEEFVSFPENCHVLLRIVDGSGSPVLGARVQGNACIKSESSTTSDALGRIFCSLAPSRTLNGIIEKQGYKPTLVSIACHPHALDAREERVILSNR